MSLSPGSMVVEHRSWQETQQEPGKRSRGRSRRRWEVVSTRGLDTPWLKLGESHSAPSCECCHVLKRICDHFIYPLTPVSTILTHVPCTTYDITRFLKKTLELNLPIATRLSGTLLQTDNSDSLLSKNHHQPTVLLFNYAKERIKQTNLGWKINLMAWIWKLCDKIFLYGKTTNYWQNKSSTFVLYLVELI